MKSTATAVSDSSLRPKDTREPRRRYSTIERRSAGEPKKRIHADCQALRETGSRFRQTFSIQQIVMPRNPRKTETRRNNGSP